MFASVSLGASLLGILLTLMMASTSIQPDWSLSILLAALLTHRGNWFWVLPGIMAHDVVFYWTMLGVFPVALMLPVLLIYSDQQLGPALPQRFFLMILCSLPMLWLGINFGPWLLTLLLCVFLWYLMADWHDSNI